MKKHKLEQLSTQIKTLHKSVDSLNKLFPQKKFTLDGRLVGDIGEVIAELIYDLELYETQKADYDGETSLGQKVQIKCTFKNNLTFKNENGYYIGLKLYSDGTFKEIYNGPAKYIYEEYKHRKGIGKALLSFPIKALNHLSNKIPQNEKILTIK